MYVFVLEWTPALTIDDGVDKSDSSHPPIPHGFIFAAYMVNKHLPLQSSLRFYKP